MIPYTSKKALVVGLARSGIAAVRLLKNLGVSVRLTEKANDKSIEAKAADLSKEGVEIELGGHSRSFVEGCDLVVISPGVRPDSEPVLWAKELGISVISEIELAFSVCPAQIIAITGTNGKTTITTLVGKIIEASGKKAHILGNIGEPFSASVLNIKKEDLVSLEISSFQLEMITNFKPKVALISNLTPDHLDRYENVQEYLDAKKRIFMNQDSDDWLILNYGDSYLRPLADETKSKVIFFNKDKDGEGFNQNQQAVLAVAQALGIKHETCLEVFRSFKGVEHRMELVRAIRGIEFINDSKATNIDSTVWALKNLKKPAVLIAGGREAKGSDFSSLIGLVKEKIKFVVLVGEASDKIASVWRDVVPLSQVKTFSEAVELAYNKALSGDCVLFSPMCKSFDMFTDYEHRGRTFKDLVNRLS